MLVRRADGSAAVAGVQRCSSIHTCPLCAPVLRAARAVEIDEAVRRWCAQGGAVALLTLTVRHGPSDPLDVQLGAVAGGWRKLTTGAWWHGGKQWTGTAERFGIEENVRALDLTVSRSAGWHSHLHVLLFLRDELSEAERQAAESMIAGRWADVVVALGAGRPTRAHGVRLDPATRDGTVLASYVAKAGAVEVGLGFEMARSDRKRGRGSGSLTAWDLLDAADRGDAWARDRWLEYCAATKHRKAITWTRGLRERVGLGDEVPDDELLDDVEGLEDAVAEPVVRMSPAVWRRVRRVDGLVALLCELVEDGRDDVAEGLVALVSAGGP